MRNSLGHRFAPSFDGDIVECIYCAAIAGGRWSRIPCDGSPEASAARAKERMDESRRRKAAEETIEVQPEDFPSTQQLETARFTGLTPIGALADKMVADIAAVQQTLEEFRARHESTGGNGQ